MRWSPTAVRCTTGCAGALPTEPCWRSGECAAALANCISFSLKSHEFLHIA